MMKMLRRSSAKAVDAQLLVLKTILLATLAILLLEFS